MNRPYVPPTVPGEGCDRFRQAALLRVDRELPAAEAAALDAHLAICPACRLKAAQAEALSTVLKDWDQNRGSQVRPPARLRISIRNAAVEQGRWRRREVRLVRRVRLATAASILLVLGGGLLFGLLASGGPTSTAFEPGPVVVADHDGPRPVYEAFEVPAFAQVDAGPSRLEGVAFDEGRVAWLAPAERAVAHRVLIRSEAMTLRREAFETHYRAKAVWVPDPATGALQLLTFADFRGLDDVNHPPRPEPSAGGDTVSVVATSPLRDTGRRIGHFLGLPGRRTGIEKLLKRSARMSLKDEEHLYGTVAFLPRPEGGARGRRKVVDLVRATRAGMLVLREVENENLVAITKGLKWPVFVPAGELIAGGEVDRVVMEGVWIPAGDEQVPTPIRCAPVGTAGASHGDAPVATGLMAGPKLRRLLASDPKLHPGTVRTWVGNHVPFDDRFTSDFSLLSHYTPDSADENVKGLVETLLRTNARGLAVLDPQGNLVSVETTELPSGSAAPLLSRIAYGYYAEISIERERKARNRESLAPRPRTGAREATLALLDLMGAEQRFRHRKLGGTGIRVLRMTEGRSKTVVDVVELLPGTSLLTSAFAP